MKINDYIEITNEDNMQLMARYPDNYFDLAIVDVPYGINEGNELKTGYIKMHSRGKLAKANKYTPKDWDNKAPEIDYFVELQRVSKNQIIWGANHFIENIPNANSSSWIVWDKDNGENDFADCELAYTSFKTAVRKIKIRWNGMLQEDMKNKELRIHPTQKPVKLYEWTLNKYAENGFKILDTNIGSASIGVAIDNLNKIEKMNLTLVGCELDKDHYKDAINRLKKSTTWQSLF